MRIYLIAIALVLGVTACASQEGVKSDKNFCLGMCSLKSDPVKVYEAVPEPVKIEPLELTIKVDRVEKPVCSKENPELC